MTVNLLAYGGIIYITNTYINGPISFPGHDSVFNVQWSSIHVLGWWGPQGAGGF